MWGERPECMVVKTRKARREHRCCECHGVIRAGEDYNFVSGIWDGEAMDFKRCPTCAALASEAADSEGFVFENLIEELEGASMDQARRYIENARARGGVVPNWLEKKGGG
jgi:hypothetical protein